ncbi:MAG TPA: ABC transporter permease subunit [Tepidisphaeraceae bacterium]|nr:ABC transporter permease subunit [Tepidisphaeraceae bacterium]
MLGIADYLWRLIPANPILLRVVESGGKRRRDLFIRCGYLGFLIGVVIFSLLSATGSFGGMSLADLAKVSSQLFRTASYWQLGLVAFLAPIFTAGAITQEKDSQTYDILLTTPMTNAQIVLGSLLSRLFFVVALLVSGVPVFAITQIFGGVAIHSIVVSFGIATATAFVFGSIAMAIAVFKVGTRRTIFSFYLFVTVYLIGTFMLDQLEAFHPVLDYTEEKVVLSKEDIAKAGAKAEKVDNLDSTSYVTRRAATKSELTPQDQAAGFNGIASTVTRTKTSWLTGINPFLALRTIFNEKDYIPPSFDSLQDRAGAQADAAAGTAAGAARRDAKATLRAWPWAWYFTNPSSFYTGFMFFLSFVLVVPSIGLLRRLAQSTTTIRGRILKFLRVSTGDKTRKPRAVWSNPIAWREAKTKASAARATVLRYGFIIAGIGGAITLVVLFATTQEPARFVRMPDSYAGPETPSPGGGQGYPKSRTLTFFGSTEQTVGLSPAASFYIRDELSPDPRPVELDQILRDYGNANLQVVGQPGYDPSGKVITSITFAPFDRRLSAANVRYALLGLIVIEFAVILLIVTNAAASTVTREKEDGTLDLLLATPITSRYYIWGKLRGLVSYVLPLATIPIASILIFVVYDLFRARADGDWIVFPEAALILPGTIVVVVAFAAILGMQMSLRCRKTVIAVMGSVGIVLGACVGLGLCGMQVVDSKATGQLGLVFGSFSPFTLVTVLVNPRQFAADAFGYSGDPTNMGPARLIVFIFGWAATGAYTLVVWGMYKSMVKNFDMTIRRQSR